MLKAVVVEFVTRTSPCSMRPNSSVPRITRAVPSYTPGLTPRPRTLRPSVRGSGATKIACTAAPIARSSLRRSGRKPLGRQRVPRLAAEKRRCIRVARLEPVARTLGQLLARGAVAGLDQAPQLRVASLDEMARIGEPPHRREPAAGGQDRPPHDPDRPEVGVGAALVAQPVGRPSLPKQLVEGGAMASGHPVAHLGGPALEVVSPGECRHARARRGSLRRSAREARAPTGRPRPRRLPAGRRHDRRRRKRAHPCRPGASEALRPPHPARPRT